MECRTPQGCVDRNLREAQVLLDAYRRTPQGCVDRNLYQSSGLFVIKAQSHPAGVRG